MALDHAEHKDSEYFEHVSYLKKSNDKKSLLFILEHEIEELRDVLEDPACSDVQSAIIRGGIVKIRELLDLLS